MIENILMLFGLGALNMVCFFVGAKIGQKVVKGEEIKLPTVNPIEVIREHKDKQEARWEQDRINAILQNLEAYDGTANGQKEVPKG